MIATAGSDDRVKLGLDLGADHGINYNTQDIRDEVMKLTGGKGVNVLYDNIANPKVLPQAFMALGFSGRLVTAGAHGGPNVTINFAHLYHKQITIIGRTGHQRSRLPKCFAAAAEGKIKAQIEKLLPLSQAAEAHRLVEVGRGDGQDRARSDAWDNAEAAPWTRLNRKVDGKTLLREQCYVCWMTPTDAPPPAGQDRCRSSAPSTSPICSSSNAAACCSPPDRSSTRTGVAPRRRHAARSRAADPRRGRRQIAYAEPYTKAGMRQMTLTPGRRNEGALNVARSASPTAWSRSTDRTYAVLATRDDRASTAP